MSAGEEITLGLYLVQQLGMMLGVGAAAIMLVAHVVANRDGVVEESEAKFARTIERVLMVGVFLIISSGIAITVLHMLGGESNIIFTPAYIFKWLIVAVVTLPLILGHQQPFPGIDFEGFVGANWLALYILHVVAPVATWVDLLIAYLLIVGVFLILWSIIARTLEKHLQEAQLPKPSFAAPKPVTVSALKQAPAISKPVVVIAPKPAPKPVVASAPLKPAPPLHVDAAPAPHKPDELPAPKPVAKPAEQKPVVLVPAKPPTKPEDITDINVNPFLPTIRVMPRTAEDVDKQLRANVVQFT